MPAVIHLDANVLVFGLESDHTAHALVTDWRRDGVVLAVSGMAWAELQCGPVSADAIRIWGRILGGAIVPVDRAVSERAAILFNRTGRHSRSLPGCIIVATAILRGAHLAILNRRDFEPLRKDRLELA